MEIALVVSAGFLGLIVGSFINVALLRSGTGVGMGGRSRCLSCGKELAVRDLVPLFSYLALRGRCRYCGSRIRVLYPLVELATSVAFILILLGESRMEWWPFWGAVAALLIFITAYDVLHRIIPERAVWLFNFIALIALFFEGGQWSTLLAGPLLALPFALLFFASRGKWMGFGDAKLALGLGWLVGLSGVLPTLAGAFWIGAGVSVGILLLERLLQSGVHRTMKSEVPFAPFLVMAAAGVILLHVTTLDILTFLDFSWLYPHIF